MNAKDSGAIAQAGQARKPAKMSAVEAAHLVGSGIVTGGIAVVLTAIAIPVSMSMSVAWGVRSLAKKLRGGSQ